MDSNFEVILEVYCYHIIEYYREQTSLLVNCTAWGCELETKTANTEP